MPPRDYDDRRVEVYFGPSRKVDVTKEELAEFIIEEMALERSDGGPKWTEGVAELVELGMEAFQEQYRDEPEYAEEIAKLNRKLDEYQSEVREIAATQQEPVDTRIQASKLAHESQARMLKVLAEAVSVDDSFIPFVDLYEVAEATDLDYSVVSYHARLLEQPDLGAYVRRDSLGEKVKITRGDAFEDFCESRGIDSDSITLDSK